MDKWLAEVLTEKNIVNISTDDRSEESARGAWKGSEGDGGSPGEEARPRQGWSRLYGYYHQ